MMFLQRDPWVRAGSRGSKESLVHRDATLTKGGGATDGVDSSVLMGSQTLVKLVKRNLACAPCALHVFKKNISRLFFHFGQVTRLPLLCMPTSYPRTLFSG